MEGGCVYLEIGSEIQRASQSSVCGRKGNLEVTVWRVGGLGV